MVIKTPTALIVSHQIPLIESCCEHDLTRDYPHGEWNIWISYNRERTAGTYLTLHNDGLITRSTLLPTGEVIGTATIKPRG